VHYGFEYMGKGPLDAAQPCNAPAFLAAASSLGAAAVVSLETRHSEHNPSSSSASCTPGVALGAALARACGRLFVHVAGTGLSDSTQMERIVLGLVQTGGWGCVSAAGALSAATVSLLSHTLVGLHAALHNNAAESVTLQGVSVRPDAGYLCFVVGAANHAQTLMRGTFDMPFT
jgi:hypothetical protein